MRFPFILAGAGLGLAACVGTTTDTTRQAAFAALSDYDALLAAADRYLCSNAGDLAAPCQPKPACTATGPRPCVEPAFERAIQASVTAALPYVAGARQLVGQGTLDGTEEGALGSYVFRLRTVTVQLRTQLATANGA